MENRKAIRVQAGMSISFQCVDQHGQSVLAGVGVIKDVSITGISFLSDQAVSLNSPIVLTFRFGDRAITMKGRVMRAVSHEARREIGVIFADDEETLTALKDLVCLV